MLVTLFVVFIIMLVLGVPIAFSMGLASTASLLVGMPTGMITIPSKIFGGLDSFSLMAVPFFILAGTLMDVSGVSRKLIRFAEMLVGFVHGGIAMVAVVASVIFAGISGSASADTAAIGAVMIPTMTEKGYEKGFSACLIAAAGTIGPVIPPSLLMILYSSATGLSVGTLFMAGILPGLLMAACLLVICYLYARKHPEVDESGTGRVGGREALHITLEALPAVLMPVIIVGGILTGIFTATEAAAVACVYAIAIGVATRELNFKKIWDALASSAKTSAQLMLIVGVATLLGWILSKEQFPQLAADFLVSLTNSKIIITLLIMALLLIVGCFMETIAALVILVPVLYPIGVAFGFDPVHFAMLIVITLLIGSITPPVGILLYISSGMAKIRFTESLKYVTPFIVALLVSALLVAYIPQITLLVPSLLGYGG
ncbi:MAG: TRAP transporter large permease [Lachnospiraceae bacterium]|nr:TRAP transporter large permease [Lachnospiraceae bacterium]